MIVEEKNEIDDHLLDIVGNEFKFSHEKGLAEWLKNSVDAYHTSGIEDSKSYVLFNFKDKDGLEFECIDFVGMTSDNIDNALKRWGDPDAAKKGTTKKVLGGHGNGGKFYMRQMFQYSRFVTYRDGKINVFGFNENRKYGFEEGYKNKLMSPRDALDFASLNKIEVPEEVLKNILSNKTGFTVARGTKPSNVGKRRFKLTRIINKFKDSPQARHILKFKPVSVYKNDKLFCERLLPEQIEPLQGFEETREVLLPQSIEWSEDGETERVELLDDNYPKGKLKLYTSKEPLSRNSRLGDLNRIDIIGEVGVIASYKMQEIGFVSYLSQAEFIYGECYCPILEKPDDDCVSNDRSKLVENIKTKAIRKWIGEQVNILGREIEEKERKKLKEKSIDNLTDINKVLNDWKDKFMSTVMRDILGGIGEGEGGGYGTGGSSGGSGGSRGGRSSNKEVGSSGQGKNEGGGSTDRKSKEAFPQILLSGVDNDPFNKNEKFSLSDRQPPVYQRPEDVPSGIYWINTSRKLAEFIIETYGVKHTKWRDYHFQRVIDVICKEALHRIFKQDPDNFNADIVDAEIIDKLVSKAQDSAIESLGSYLFETEYTTPKEELIDKVSKLKHNLSTDELEGLLKDIEEAINSPEVNKS